MKRISLLVVSLMLLTLPAFAAPPNYLVVKAGGYLPQSSDMEEFDNAFYGELGLGHYLTPNIALELDAGWTKSSASAAAPGVSADVDLTIIPITLGLKFSLPTGTFEPYATAGVGLYYAKAEASAFVSGLGSASGSENDTTFGGFIGLGANINVTPTMFIGLEGKYLIASPSFNDVDVDIDGITLTANLGFRF